MQELHWAFQQCCWDSSEPRIEGGDAGGNEVGGVAGDDGHGVYQCGCCDEGVVFRTWVRNVKCCRTASDLDVDRQDTSGEGLENNVIDPRAKDGTLYGITSRDLKGSQLQLQHSHDRDIYGDGGDASLPSHYISICTSGGFLTKFGDYIRIE